MLFNIKIVNGLNIRFHVLKFLYNTFINCIFSQKALLKKTKQITVVIYDEKKRKKNKKTLHIGQMGYQDYPQHKDEERKQRYIERHQKNEDWEDIFSKGFWARFIFWNKKTIRESIEDIEKRFNLKRI